MKEKHHYGIIKIDQIRKNHLEVLLKIIDSYKDIGLADIYINIGYNKITKEIKKYTKKGKFKQFYKLRIDIQGR